MEVLGRGGRGKITAPEVKGRGLRVGGGGGVAACSKCTKPRT